MIDYFAKEFSGLFEWHNLIEEWRFPPAICHLPMRPWHVMEALILNTWKSHANGLRNEDVVVPAGLGSTAEVLVWQ